MSTAIKETPTLATIPSFVPVNSLIRAQDTGNTYIGTGTPNVELFASPDVPGGFGGDIQYNNGAGAFAGSAATIDAAGNLTLPATLIDGAGSPGTAGYLLSSTHVGVKWVVAPAGGAGSLLLNTVLKAGNYTPNAADQVVLFTATAIATLDSTLVAETHFWLKNISGSGTLTVTPSSGTLDNQSSWALSSMESVHVLYDGVNWWTI